MSSEPQSVTAAHDFLLLSAPSLDAPALAWIAAGTSLNARTSHDGFVAVTYDNRQGFLPLAICTPYAETSAVPIILAQTCRLRPRYTQTVLGGMQPIIPAHAPLHRLGNHHLWSLVQDQNGQIGFIDGGELWTATSTGTMLIGCAPAVWWYLLGAGWSAANWLGAPMIFGGITDPMPEWTAMFLIIIMAIGPFAMLARSRSDTATLFSAGALTIGLSGGALSIAYLLS